MVDVQIDWLQNSVFRPVKKKQTCFSFSGATPSWAGKAKIHSHVLSSLNHWDNIKLMLANIPLQECLLLNDIQNHWYSWFSWYYCSTNDYIIFHSLTDVSNQQYVPRYIMLATNTMSKKRKWHLVPQYVSLEATATLSVSGLITNDHHHHHHHQQQVPTSSSIV